MRRSDTHESKPQQRSNLERSWTDPRNFSHKTGSSNLFRDVAASFLSNRFMTSLKRMGKSHDLGRNNVAERLFDIYDTDRVGILKDDQIACMLQDFHGSCGISMELSEEMEIVKGLEALGTEPKRGMSRVF